MAQITVEQAMQLALEHHQAGRLAEAEAAYRGILAWFPDNAGALNSLGVLAGQVGHTDAAIDLIRRAIAVNPGDAACHGNLGELYRRKGNLEEAVVFLRNAIAIDPAYAIGYNNLGNALRDLGRLGEAIDACRRAIALAPELAEPCNNLGNALKDQGRLDEAIAAYHQAISLKPDFALAHNNLGSALTDLGRIEEAVAALRQALQLQPDLAAAHSNLGYAWRAEGRLEEAIAACRQAIRLAPEMASAHNNLGNLFKDQGRLDEAIASFRKAVEVKPDFARAGSNLLLTLHYHPDHDARSILEEHRRWARQFAEPLAAQVRPHPNDRTTDRRLRVGYVSPDFRDHAVGHLLLPLLSHHDRRQVEIIGYSDVCLGDAVTEQLRSLTDRWHGTVGLSDQQLADLIRGEGIDILVDLALHTANNRMLVFARKPAPVQVTMLGMPATTGLSTMDYRLTDPYLDPPGMREADYAEHSIRLPHCYWCYRPPEEAPPVGPPPALENGFITFGCLNQFTKVSRPALELWAKVLQAVPGSRLVLLIPSGKQEDAVRAAFRASGIADERIALAARGSRRVYLEHYNAFDLSLDPFPYNGHTSALDSLWMGVPVITLAGTTAVGRGGVSILSNMGLPELIARTPEAYIATAVDWAGQPGRLALVRAGLRQRMSASPLVDGKQFAADVETVFRQVWNAWCRA